MKSPSRILAIILLLAGTILSQAASYTNTLAAGFNLIANHLNGNDNQLETVFPAAQDGDALLKWDYAMQRFSDPYTYFDGLGWLPTTTLNPGEGAAYSSSSPTVITMSGTQGVVNLPLPYLPGLNLVSRQMPAVGSFQSIMGFNPPNGAQFIRLNRTTQTYDTNSFNGSVWSGGNPTANIGESVFIFLPEATLPVITQQPVSQTTTDGQRVTFTVGATGTPPLSFQWQRNGSNIPGAIITNFSIAKVVLADNGAEFSVTVSNAAGLVTSTNAILTVNADDTPPTVLAVTNTPNFMQVRIRFSERVTPSSVTNLGNYSIPGISIISAVLGPDGSNVIVTVSALTEGASYTLSIQNIVDLSSTTNVLQPNPSIITFQAAVPPVITLQPQDHAVNPGAPASFNVIASGTAPLGYQWYKGLSLISNAVTDTLQFPAVQQSDLGNYRVVVMNSAGAVTSAVANLSFPESYTLNLPAGFSLIANQLSNPGFFPPVPDGTQLSIWRVATGGFESYAFNIGEWSPQPPSLLPGQGAIINLPQPASLTFTGQRVTGGLPQNPPPNLNLLSARVPIVAGYNNIIGSPPREGQVVYQFRPGGNPSIFDENNYRLSFFRYGRWYDGPPKIGVGESVWIGFTDPVVITTQPVGQTGVPPGQSVTFFVEVSGAPPIHFQWLLNGSPIPGATKADYAIPSVNPTNAGIYTVIVGNTVGDVVSLPAPLTLSVPGFDMADDFDAQIPVSNFSATFRSHNRGATRAAGEPLHAGRRANASVWLTWIAPQTGIISMSTAGSAFDTVLAAYTGDSFSKLVLVDASDDDAGYGCSRIAFNAIAGTPYRICVAGLGDETGDIMLSWNLQVTQQKLPEIVSQPQDLSIGLGSNATFAVVVTNGTFTYQWFRNGLPLAQETKENISINNVKFDDVGTYFVRIINDNLFRDSEMVSLQLEFPEPGQPFTGARGAPKFFDFDLPADGRGQPPKGGGPAKLIVGTVNHGYSGSGALPCFLGRDPGEPFPCNLYGANTSWYAVQAATNGTMYVGTDGSNFDTLLAAYIGPGNSYITLTNVACDNNSGLDGYDSRMNFPTTTGQTYFLQVQGVGAASGTVALSYRLVRPLTITNIVHTNGFGGRFTMRVVGTSNLLTRVQYSTNLNTTNWITLTNYTPVSGTFNFTNNNVGSSTNRIYRALHVF